MLHLRLIRSKSLIAAPHLSGLELFGHNVIVGKFKSSIGLDTDSIPVIVGFSSHASRELIQIEKKDGITVNILCK